MKYILPIILISSLFADTIVYRYEKIQINEVLVYNTEIEGEYLGTLNGKVYLRKTSGELENYECESIIAIFDDKRVLIPRDCSENTYTPKYLTELDVKDQKNAIIGGIFITVGGVLLMTSLDLECSDCSSVEDFEDFNDGVKIQNKLAYGFIIVGGIFISLGI